MPSILARIHCLHFSRRLFGSSLKCVVYLQQSERSDHLGAARTLAVVRCHQPVLSLHRSACKSLSLSDIRCCRAFCSRREWGRVPHKWARGGIPPPPATTTLDDISKLCMKFGYLILRKIIKFVATRCQILRLKCTKFDFGCGSAPKPRWGSLQRYPSPRSWIKGPCF